MPSPIEAFGELATTADGKQTVRLNLWLLGLMAATDAQGNSLLPRARKTRALLAILALAAPRPVLRTRLVALLWSRRESEQARASLRQALHELQGALGQGAGALLWADRNHLALREDNLWVDVQEIARASASNPEVLNLLKGDLLEDLEGLDPRFDGWLAAERARLRGVARDLAESLLDTQRDPDAIIAVAERLLTIDSSHERAWRAMIEANLDRGDHGAAVAAFDRCRAALFSAGGFLPGTDLDVRIADVRHSAAHQGNTPDAGLTVTTSGHAGQPTSHTRRRRVSQIRLGVMPMRPLDSRGVDPLSLGLAEEITTALSRFRWISCVASPSIASLAKQPADRKLWESLDLDFMLDGTIQRSSERVRITSRLLDMRENGAVIWARRFDRDMTDILALQDEIAAETVAQVDPELLLREGDRALRRASPPDPTAYDLMLRAIPAIYRLEQTGFIAAGAMLKTAISIDPGHAASHAWLAYWHLFWVGQGWSKDPIADTAQGGAMADRAVTLDPNDARGLTLSGHVRAFLAKRSEEAIALHERALSLNPNLPMAWAFIGHAHSYLGRHKEAIGCINQAQRLSPFDPHGFFFDTALMMPYLLTHQHETVTRIGRRAIELNPGFSSSYKGVLAALGHLGRKPEATEILARLLALEPRFTLNDAISRSPILRPDDLAHYAEGLRLAGLR